MGKFHKFAAALAFRAQFRYDKRNREGFEVEILFEDAALLVCVKPRGVLSAPDASGKESMASLLAPRQIFPVHRLDRDATGLMVFAKTAAAAAYLSGQMDSGFEKIYLARCQGTPPSEGSFSDLLFHDRQKNKTYVVKRPRKGVKEASLDYRVLATQNGRSLIQVQLHTGRTHQIRVQFASRALPLAGDGKYGGKEAGSSFGLWAWRLAFPHPVTGNVMEFTHQPPQSAPWTEFATAL